MVSLGDGTGEFRPTEGNKNADFAHAETQPFNSQSSPLQFLGDKIDDLDGHELQSTRAALFYDDVPVENAMETQVVNLDGETQVWNLGGETQVLDDSDYIENVGIDTQLLDEFDDEVSLESDGEGTDTTEVLSDNDDLLDDEPVIRGHSPSSGEKKIKGTSFCEHDCNGTMEQSDALIDKQRSSALLGSVITPEVKITQDPKSGPAPRFTSIRVASLRASALAARNSGLKVTKRGSSSVLADSQFLDQLTVHNNGANAEGGKDNVQIHDLEKNETLKALSERNNRKVGRSAARKLFAEESLTDNNRFSSTNENSDAREDMDPLSDVLLAGLSYVDSQEPGELSQANALNFVERLINDNLKEFDIEVDCGKSTREKPNPVLSAKGPKDLAKKANERIIFGETSIFEWDDNCEDDGGGDIFCRRKGKFYGSRSQARKSLTEPHRPKGRKLDGYRDKREQLCGLDKIMAHSDSKTKEEKQTGQEAEMKFRRNLINEFDQQSNIDSSRGQLKANAIEADMPEEQNVGPDTQMAAEAMEALCCGEGITDYGANVDYQGVQNDPKGSPKASPGGKHRKRVLHRQSTAGTKVCHSDIDLATRQSKRTKKLGARLCEEPSILLQKCSKNVRKKCHTELLIPKTKRAKSHFEKHHTANGSEGLGITHKTINERNEDTLTERSETHESTTLHSIVKLAGDSSIKGSYFQEKVCTPTPIAHQTRQSMDVNFQGAEKTPTAATEVSSHIVEASSVQENITGSFPKQRRSHRKLSVNINESNNLDALSKPAVWLEENCKSNAGLKPSRSYVGSTCVDLSIRRKTLASAGKMSETSNDVHHCSADMNGKMKSRIMGAKEINHSDRSDAILLASESMETDFTVHKSPNGKPKPSVCTTPVNCATPINSASPVCMGDEYFKQSCKKNLSRYSLMKEIRSLSPLEPEPISPLKDLRKRRDLANVRIMFSHHLDDDIITQQRKILARLGISEVSSIVDATHFVTDKFVRTRNMLEAIASGKPVVTRLWLESVGQVNIHIDEETYILRDIKKEKEFGFCMPVSLARARKNPLLEGRRVFITPNTKPGKEIISSLVKTVCGQAVERIGRSVLKDDNMSDDLLVLSCEEDYTICVPFLEKGTAVYSSELLLNGIVTQRLEYERHRLFTELVKRTRSTTRLKNNDKFLPVRKHK
ncbi:hypothetical protein SLEP1_g226 [Rubroshorea leprosula]|uniref:BRCT domain-containing protein n=1 Tax=Rubroshorea leprosula TaxID=152421 RepID=A0AAV5HK97_9ROSI|nr:hypothetical protein SLEP1_g226 [Rubroshorea leprosula]